MNREDIIGYLFDALDPEDQEAIEQRMARDPAFREEVQALRKLTWPLAQDDCIEPPPNLAGRTLDVVRRAAYSVGRKEWAATHNRVRPVDVLVAACVLGVAATLVVPAVATLRGDQARVLCADNLRRLGVSLSIYADMENGHFPYVASTGPTNNAGIFSVLLKSRDLIGDPRALTCPAANSAVVLVPDMPRYLDSLADPFRYSRLRRYMAGSYGYALGYEENGAYRGHRDFSPSVPIASDQPPRTHETQFSNTPNHGDRGQNVLFTDGSVRWFGSPRHGKDDLFRNRHSIAGAGAGPDDCVIGVSEATPYPRMDL